MYNPIDQDTKLQPKIFKQMDMASTMGPMGSPLSLHHFILYLTNSVTPFSAEKARCIYRQNWIFTMQFMTHACLCANHWFCGVVVKCFSCTYAIHSLIFMSNLNFLTNGMTALLPMLLFSMTSQCCNNSICDITMGNNKAGLLVPTIYMIQTG